MKGKSLIVLKAYYLKKYTITELTTNFLIYFYRLFINLVFIYFIKFIIYINLMFLYIQYFFGNSSHSIFRFIYFYLLKIYFCYIINFINI
jgi:hypothetical protein